MNKSTETARQAAASQTSRDAAQKVDSRKAEMAFAAAGKKVRGGRVHNGSTWIPIRRDGGDTGYRCSQGPNSGWKLERPAGERQSYTPVDPDGKEYPQTVGGLRDMNAILDTLRS